MDASHKYNVGDRVTVKIGRCPCVGGGFDEKDGTITEVIVANNHIAYRINNANVVIEAHVKGKI